MAQGVTMPLSGFLIRWTGARPAMFLGCAIFSLGTASTYFTLEMV
jgi:MFS family permease